MMLQRHEPNVDGSAMEECESGEYVKFSDVIDVLDGLIVQTRNSDHEILAIIKVTALSIRRAFTGEPKKERANDDTGR